MFFQGSKKAHSKPIGKIPEDKYVQSVIGKFCMLATSNQLPILTRLDNIKMVRNFLRWMYAFESGNNQQKLEQIQKGLFTDGQTQKNSALLTIAIAMNTIINFLKKGGQDEGARKFYDSIKETIERLNEEEEKLTSILEKENSQASSSVHTTPDRFFSPDSTNSPPKKRPRITEEHEEKAQSKEENVDGVDTVQEQESSLEIQAH